MSSSFKTAEEVATSSQEVTGSVNRADYTRGVFYVGGIEELFSNVPFLLYFWDVDDRIAYKKPVRLKGMFAAIALILGLYFWWVGQPLMTLAVVGIFYIYYLIITMPPMKVRHIIYSNGLFSIDRLYPWENLKDFWFAEMDGRYILYVNTTLKFPASLIMLIPDKKTLGEVALILGQFLPYADINGYKAGIRKWFTGRPIEPSVLIPAEVLLYNKSLLQEKLSRIIQRKQKEYQKKVAKR